MNRVINLVLLGAIVAAVAASFAYLQLDLQALVGNGGLGQMGEYAGRFLHPDWSAGHLKAVWHGALETLAMSGLGTLLAMVLGMLLALPAAGRFGWPLQGAARLLLNALRAIPELVWAALTVLAAGLGPNAGTLALALHTAGVLGRLFAEALENAPPEPAAAIRLQGVARWRPSALARCPMCGRSCWRIACTAGRTTFAWPACWGLSGRGAGAAAVHHLEPVPGSPGQYGDPWHAGAGVAGGHAQ